jgi:hypothetical protein
MKNRLTFAISLRDRELAEWSIAAVLKTVDCYRSGGSNPSLSTQAHRKMRFFYVLKFQIF